MDSRREPILVLLSVFMVMKYVIVGILAFQKIAIFQHNAQMMMMAVFIMEGCRMTSRRTCWQRERYGGFLECTLLGSYSEVDFRKRLRVSISTFNYLCTLLGPVLKKDDTHLRQSIPVECRVAVTLSRLATGHTLMMIGDLFGIGESTTSKIVRDCCEAIRIYLRPLVFKKPTLIRMKKIASEFEALHGIPLILGAIDGSHIPIIAPPHDPTSYYCRKGFYSCLLQGVVDSKCKFWDYDFGWSGRIHDWALFQKSEIGKKTMKGAFLPFKFIGDAAYPMRPWFYSPFKGEREGLCREKAYWNFIQSSTRMAVERAFGILKGRWRILLKRIDIPLRNLPDIVTATLCLHNMCILENDKFDMDWAKVAEKELQDEANKKLGNFQVRDMFHVLESSLREMRELQKGNPCAEDTPFIEPEEEEEIDKEENSDHQQSRKERQDNMKNMLIEATRVHELLAKSFYKANLAEKSNIRFEGYNSDSE